MSKKKNSEIAKTLLEIISKDLPYSSCLELLGDLSQYHWVEKPNAEVALHSNTKQPIPALLETIDNHEDAYTELMLDMNPSLEINSLEEVLPYSSQWSGKLTDSYYNQITYTSNSPYLYWNQDRKIWVIFSVFDKIKNTRNITTIDNAKGLTSEAFSLAFHEDYGKSNKSDKNCLRGKLGLGEASVLPHCAMKLTATRKNDYYKLSDSEMVLGFSILLQDSDLIYQLTGKNTEKACIIEMVNEKGKPITATSQDLIDLFYVNGIKFEETDNWSYEQDKNSQNPKPKTFQQGFLNKLIDFALPKSYLDQEQISEFPENNFTQVVNSSYTYLNHPVVVCEANPKTREGSITVTAKNVHVKPARYLRKAFGNYLKSTHEILLSFTPRLSEAKTFPIPIDVIYLSKEDAGNLKTNQKGIFITNSGGRSTRLRKSQSVHSVVQSIVPNQAMREACKRMVIIVDLSQLPRSWSGLLFNADKVTIDHNSTYCKSILDQIETTILNLNNENFANIYNEEQSLLNQKQVVDANIEKVKGKLLSLIRSPLPSSTDGDCTKGQGSGSYIITRNPKNKPITLMLLPTYIELDNECKNVCINSKRAYVQFKTNGKEQCFYKRKNNWDRDKIKIMYKDINITDSFSYSHGVLKVGFDLSIIEKTETQRVGDEFELNFNIESQCGLKSEGKFIVNLIESISNPNKPKSSSNPPHLSEIKKQCNDIPTPQYEFLSKKEYEKRVKDFFNDEEFDKALNNQYPNMSVSQYIKYNSLCFIVKDGSDNSLALLNQELLPTIIFDNQINNTEFQEEILMSSMDVCINKNVFLINNTRLRYIVQKSVSKSSVRKNLQATRKIAQPKNKSLTKS